MRSRRYCSLYIAREDLDPDIISSYLGAPDCAHQMGDEFVVNGKTKTRVQGSWSIQSSEHVSSNELADHVQYIASFISGKSARFEALAVMGYQFRLRIFWDLRDEVLSAVLPAHLLTEICKVAVAVDLSVV